MAIRERLLFWLAYLRGRTPWDTNITPPELVRTIEGANAPPPGRALDLGCGTGTNVIYMAQHNWDAVGVDFIDKAIQRARDKARAAGIDARFFTGDVTRLERIKGLGGPFDLALDIGCFHSLASELRERYVAGLAQQLRPGATFMLYAWQSHDKKRGVSSVQVERMFAPGFHITQVERGRDRRRTSAWYWFEFSPEN